MSDTSNPIRFYGLSDELPDLDSDQSRLLKRYVGDFMKRGIVESIYNADTRLGFASLGPYLIPYTVGRARRGLSYVCSPQSHYIDYATEELSHLSSRLDRWAGRALLPLLGLLCRWGELDRVVMVNNWLLSTNLYPELSVHELLRLRDALRERYPDHAIVFRSLDEYFHQAKLEVFKAQGLLMVMSRRVHIIFRGDESAWRHNSLKNDQRLQRKTTYERVRHDDLKPEDFERIETLYRLLYIDKYSSYNPEFSADFLQHLWRTNSWQFSAWRKEGQLDAVCATISVNGIRSAPLIGYDTSKPKSEGLYRLAYLDMLEAGRSRGEHIHCSAGVAVYKQHRGAQSFLEYNAVSVDHLNWRRAFPWRLLRWIVDRHIAPQMIAQNL